MARKAWCQYNKEIIVGSIDWEEDGLMMTRVEVSTVKSRHVIAVYKGLSLMFCFLFYRQLCPLYSGNNIWRVCIGFKKGS